MEVLEACYGWNETSINCHLKDARLHIAFGNVRLGASTADHFSFFLIMKDAMAFFSPLRLSGSLNFDSRACQEWPEAIPGGDTKL
jgi:hypothetical protein